uniref:Ring finger protein 4 n=1 Tax=Sciurus vulgaris TaxID=55149 RepID=A0A8D2D9Q8_SCIVU
MSTRKRRGGTVSSRQAQKRTREAASTPEISLEAEPIELVETAGDEIVDLTCESLEPVVVDLTHNDSVVIVDGPLVLSVVPSAWTDTQRLCRMDVSLSLQSVATSSVASASVIPLRMLTLAQLVGKRSTTNDTTPFIYEVSELLRRDGWTDSPAWFLTWYLPPIS